MKREKLKLAVLAYVRAIQAPERAAHRKRTPVPAIIETVDMGAFRLVAGPGKKWRRRHVLRAARDLGLLGDRREALGLWEKHDRPERHRIAVLRVNTVAEALAAAMKEKKDAETCDMREEVTDAR